MVKSKISNFISLVLKVVFIAGIVALFFVPKLYDMFSGLSDMKFIDQSMYYKIAFYLCSMISLGIIYQLIIVFNDVYKDSPFKKSIERGLKILAVLFMLLSIIVTLKTIFIPTILSIAVSFITFIISLSFYVLSQIFKVAIEYKDEVDSMV